MFQRYLETENISYLKEAHMYYQQCETGRYKKKDISRRFGLYVVVGDYDGGRNYLSKLTDIDYPESLSPSLLRMQFDIYEQYERTAYIKVDSLMHVFLKEHARLYKQTKKDHWLQEMIVWHQECCEKVKQLSQNDVYQAFNNPHELDLDSLLLLIDCTSYSIGDSYFEIVKIRDRLHDKDVLL